MPKKKVTPKADEPTLATAFTAAELAAIAGAVKDAQAKKAKGELKEGGLYPVDFKVRFAGNVQKAYDAAGMTMNVPQTVELATLPVFCKVLRLLGIGELRLNQALECLPETSQIAPDPELAQVFEINATKMAEKLPPKPVTTNGKCGAVTTTISFNRA